MFDETSDAAGDARLNEQQRRVESMLRSLSPRGAEHVDPLVAAFAAGRRSAARETRVWRAAAAVALLVGISGWVVQIGHGRLATSRLGSPPVAVLPAVTSPAGEDVAAAPQAPSPQSVLMLRQAIRDHGVDGLPPAGLAPAPVVRPLTDSL